MLTIVIINSGAVVELIPIKIYKALNLALIRSK
jgi:hypothetical protein